jgi:hypothetical protein
LDINLWTVLFILHNHLRMRLVSFQGYHWFEEVTLTQLLTLSRVTKRRPTNLCSKQDLGSPLSLCWSHSLAENENTKGDINEAPFFLVRVHPAIITETQHTVEYNAVWFTDWESSWKAGLDWSLQHSYSTAKCTISTSHYEAPSFEWQTAVFTSLILNSGKCPYT